MELRFVSRELRRLDQSATEVLMACVTSDERPPHGLAGLVDFRLAGRISHLMASGFLLGSPGEVLLLPGRPKLPFDKVLLFGLGPRRDFGEHVFRATALRMIGTLEGLRARTAVAELPGRYWEGIAPERSADLLLELAAGRSGHDLWTIVEPNEAQRQINEHMVRERRRERS